MEELKERIIKIIKDNKFEEKDNTFTKLTDKQVSRGGTIVVNGKQMTQPPVIEHRSYTITLSDGSIETVDKDDKEEFIMIEVEININDNFVDAYDINIYPNDEDEFINKVVGQFD